MNAPQSSLCPTLSLRGLKLVVTGYEFPDATCPYDANWLMVEASYATASTSSSINGSNLETISFARFLRQLRDIDVVKQASAKLRSDEPYYSVEVSALGSDVVEGKRYYQMRTIFYTRFDLNLGVKEEILYSCTLDHDEFLLLINFCEKVLTFTPLRNHHSRRHEIYWEDISYNIIIDDD
jgi:hypothetical protein